VPEKRLDRAIQISASGWRKTMNRRHSQFSNATMIKSLTMSDGVNAAIGPSRRVQGFTHSVVIGGLIQINGQGGGEYPASCFHTEREDDMPEKAFTM
jgi:hypothetical protein